MKYIMSFFVAATSLVSQPLTNDNGFRPAWGLDRIDQRTSVLNDSYTYNLTGEGVDVYVFDSGINSSHEEFTGRIKPGFSIINDGYGTEDCAGHGSHTASLVGGTTYGVAKRVTLIPVRVLNCSNTNASTSTLYSAIDWIIAHHKPGVPAIVNMSVGMTKSLAFNEAVRKLIADGLIVVGAAGNQSKDACLYSPASENSIIAVGGTGRTDGRGTQSNWGLCVDIFAPGWDLVGAWSGASNNYRSSSGTSNAAPIVSGIAALMLEENPTLTQSQVEQKLKSSATVGVLSNIGTGSPNLLAYSHFLSGESVPTTTTTTISPATTTTVAPTTTVPMITTTTTAVVTTTTVTRAVSPTTTAPVQHQQINMTCAQPAARTSFYGVPHVCVNTGNQLMWISQRYSPGRP